MKVTIYSKIGGEMMVTIGIDYGDYKGDMSIYTVVRRVDGIIQVIDTGKIEDFDYTKYVATEHQVVGEQEHLEKFRSQFMNK